MKTIKLDLSYGPLPENHGYARPPRFFPEKFPWVLKDESVEEAFSAYLFQRIPGKDRGWFMDELHRVLVPGGKCLFIVPYWSSSRSIQDPMAEWPPLCEASFLYFNKNFRTANKLDYGIKCDFDFSYGYALEQETMLKADDVRPFWAKHYINAINDLNITLMKRP